MSWRIILPAIAICANLPFNPDLLPLAKAMGTAVGVSPVSASKAMGAAVRISPESAGFFPKFTPVSQKWLGILAAIDLDEGFGFGTRAEMSAEAVWFKRHIRRAAPVLVHFLRGRGLRPSDLEPIASYHVAYAKAEDEYSVPDQPEDYPARMQAIKGAFDEASVVIRKAAKRVLAVTKNPNSVGQEDFRNRMEELYRLQNDYSAFLGSSGVWEAVRERKHLLRSRYVEKVTAGEVAELLSGSPVLDDRDAAPSVVGLSSRQKSPFERGRVPWERNGRQVASRPQGLDKHGLGALGMTNRDAVYFNPDEIPRLSETVEVRKSNISGRGLFAKRIIERGEVIAPIRGPLAVRNGHHVLWLDAKDGKYTPVRVVGPAKYANSSQQPNVELAGKKAPKLVALRPILMDEEITWLYELPSLPFVQPKPEWLGPVSLEAYIKKFGPIKPVKKTSKRRVRRFPNKGPRVLRIGNVLNSKDLNTMRDFTRKLDILPRRLIVSRRRHFPLTGKVVFKRTGRGLELAKSPKSRLEIESHLEKSELDAVLQVVLKVAKRFIKDLPPHFPSVYSLGRRLSVVYSLRRQWVGPYSAHDWYFDDDKGTTSHTLLVNLTPGSDFFGGDLYLTRKGKRTQGQYYPALDTNEGMVLRTLGIILDQSAMSPVSRKKGGWHYQLCLELLSKSLPFPR